MKKSLFLIWLFLLPMLMFAQDMIYMDQKLSDNDPKFKLFSYNLPNPEFGISYADESNKCYLLISNSTIVEFDLKNSTKDNCVSRTFTLENNAALRGSYIKVSFDSRYLAYIDDQDVALHIVDINTTKEVTTYPLGKKYNNFDKGIKYSFVSNNEVLVAGATKAALFNITNNKATTFNLKNDNNQPTVSVTTHKVINKEKTCFVIDNTNNMEYNPERVDQESQDCYVKCISGYICSYIRKIDNANVHDFGQDLNGNKCFSWNKELGCVKIQSSDMTLSFPKMSMGMVSKNFQYYILWNESVVHFFDYTLLNIELEKQKLINAIERKDVNEIVNFKGIYSTGYNAIAKRESMRLASNAYKSITSNSISPSHAKELEVMIDMYKEGPAVDSAKTELATLYKTKYNSIDKDAIADLRLYKENYPNSPYVNNINALIAYKSITSNSTTPLHVEELEDVIVKYKDCPAVDSAKAELESLYKTKYNSINKDAIADLNAYIINYPRSPYCSQAKKDINNFYKSKYDAVCRTNDSWAYRDYANNYPNSPYASAAKDAADRIDQQVAERQKAEQQRIEQEQRQAESQAMRETMSNSVGRYVTWTETAAYDISKGDEGLIGSLISNKLGLNTVKYIVKYTAIVKTVLGESLEVIISSAEIQKESWVSANWLKYKNYANTDVQKSVGQTRIKQFNEVSLK